MELEGRRLFFREGFYMKWKLLAVDVDGTLLTDDGKITKENQEAITKAISKGIHFVLCSGRSSASIRQVADQIENIENEYIIGFNGGEIMKLDTEEVLVEKRLDKNDAIFILEHIKKLDDVVPFVYLEADVALAEKNHPALAMYTEVTGINFTFGDFNNAIEKDVNKVILIGLEDHITPLSKHLKEWLPPHIHSFRSTPTLIEFAPRCVNKGDAVEELTKILGCSMDQVVSVGDSENDLSMIEKAKVGIAVSNASPMLKEKADAVTKNDNNTSAVAEVIDWMISENEQAEFE